jgi:hypothetical protein
MMAPNLALLDADSSNGAPEQTATEGYSRDDEAILVLMSPPKRSPAPRGPTVDFAERTQSPAVPDLRAHENGANEPTGVLFRPRKAV